MLGVVEMSYRSRSITVDLVFCYCLCNDGAIWSVCVGINDVMIWVVV